MSNPEQLHTPVEEIPNVGIREDDLTDDMCQDVLAIYLGAAYGGEEVPAVFGPDYFQLDIARVLNHARTGFRLGSQFSVHSKLIPTWVHEPVSDQYLLKFRFVVNEDIPEEAHGLKRQVEETGREFDRRVAQYLLETGRGVTIETA